MFGREPEEQDCSLSKSRNLVNGCETWWMIERSVGMDAYHPPFFVSGEST
jgi:hypothetical protein